MRHSRSKAIFPVMALSALLLTGCDNLAALGQIVDGLEGTSLSGTVTGSAATSTRLKVMVIPGVASDPTSPSGQSYSASGGSFTLRVRSEESRSYTVFAYLDANLNGRYDRNESSSFGATGTNTYCRLTWTGANWSIIQETSSGNTTVVAEDRLTMRLDATDDLGLNGI